MDIMRSMQAILSHEATVVCSFYGTFFKACPAAQSFFDGIDIEHQALKLTSALLILEMYYRHKYATGAEYLKFLGGLHQRIGVPREMYAAFRCSLLDTLKDFHGQDWSDELAQEWEAAIDLGVDVMLAEYGSPEE